MANSIENRGPELLAVNITFITTALISIFLRCYVRVFKVKAFGFDDWLMAVATVFFTLYDISSSIGTHYGTGRHHEDLETRNIHTAMMCWWFCFLWYCLTMTFCKISIGWFLLRVTNSKIHKWIIYIAMLSTAFSSIVFFFVSMLQCRPIPYFWNKDIEGRCINIEVIIGLATLYSVFAVLSDLIFAILPGVIVWNLQLHRRTKVLLFPLLAMGCVASFAVLVRFPFLQKFRQPDFLWNTVDIAIWSTVEQGLAITAGSLATLKPLIKAVGHRFGLTSNPTASGNYNLSSSRMSRLTPKAKLPSDTVRQQDLSYFDLESDTPDSKGGGIKAVLPEGFTAKKNRESKNRTQPRLTPVGENDSEEELHSPRLWREHPRVEQMLR